MFIEVLVIVKGKQTSIFYGPFATEALCEEYKNYLQGCDTYCFKHFGEERNPARIKYLSCDTLPPGDWKQLPLEWPFHESFCWVRPEDADEITRFRGENQ